LGERFDPFFKPEWSPDLLLSFAYMSHLTVVRRTLFDELGGLRSEFDGSQDYDFTLRASERARLIVHIAAVLYHWRSMPGSAASDTAGQQAKPWAYEAGRRAIEDALERRNEPGVVSTLEEFPGRYHVRRAVTGRPLVSIIIPFRDEPALLATCTRTLRESPGYDNYELILVDNDSALPETHALLDELVAEPNVRLLRAPGPFNWAAINNSAARASSGELLLFLNNDIEAEVPGWLDAMVGHAQRREVGAVGARLLYPDGTIQHAGVVIGLGGIAGHVLRGLPGDQPGYASLAISTRNCSVVTGAAMMVRKDVFFEVGGFDETLAVAFNDVDFCLKLRERGFLIVFSPLTELIHHESKSRGHTDDAVENKLMLTRWRAVMVAGDPYHNRHLSHWRYWCPLSTAQEDDRWKNYLETRILTLDSSSNE
jgi:GT2 family glycosyltransferase